MVKIPSGFIGCKNFSIELKIRIAFRKMNAEMYSIVDTDETDIDKQKLQDVKNSRSLRI